MLLFLIFPLLLPALSALANFEINPPYECSPKGDSPRHLGSPSCLENSVREERDAYCEPISISELDASEADQIFRELAENPEIPFRFLPDGCQARAQRMAEIFIKKGFYPAKIFVKGKFEFENPWDPLWRVRWQYHVAIVLKVHRELVVMDPSLFSKPVGIEYFLDFFRQLPVTKIDEVFLTDPYVYELNHRDLILSGFRSRDLECGEELIRTGLIFQKLQKRP